MDDKTSKAASEKAKALAAALSQIEKQFGKGSIMRYGDNEVEHDIQVVSTGSLGLDIALGVGGLPRGRVVEIYGPESSGKTTLTLQVIAEMQKIGALVPSSMLSTRWMSNTPPSWVSTWRICSSPNRTPASKRSRSPMHWCAPVRWILSLSIRSRLWCPRPKSRARWATPCRVCRRA